MKYRYFSTQRPVAPGTFPKKPGCEISNYPQKIYIDGTGFSAWGHIDYDEPLTDAEDGTKPFADYTFEKFFEVMMQSGSFHTMNRHIENMEYENGLKRKG